MPLLIVIAGIILLLLLIIVFKLNAFISFVIVSLSVAIAEGMPFERAITSIQKGIGDTLGFLVLILGFGAMLGKLVAESGAAQRITSDLVRYFGKRNIQWAVVLAGFIVGVPMFYSVGFVILIPLVFTVAAATELPLLYVGMPMLASLSVTHGYLPPHPAPTAIAGMFGADIGKTLFYGVMVAIPAIILGGPLYARTIKKIKARPLEEFVHKGLIPQDRLPGMVTSIVTALFPVILIGLSTLLTFFIKENAISFRIIKFVGDPVIAMLLSVLLAVVTLGLARGRKMKELMDDLTHSVASITMVLAIGSGSLMFSHVNDGGFWMFKEYFNLSIRETLATWTVLETTVGVVGLIGVLIINSFV